MKRPQFLAETPVPEAMDAAHDIPSVFIAHRAACIGCALARFCTLKDVASTYGLSLEAFLAELENAVRNDPLSSKGVRHEKLV